MKIYIFAANKQSRLMKKSLIHFFDKIILVLLGFSGILYSCAKYGMPENEFEIKGAVFYGSTSKPVKDIRIIRGDKRFEDRADTLYTTADGKFAFHFYNFSNSTHLKIEDIDGEANGGEFLPQKINVTFTDADRVKKSLTNKRGDKFLKKLNIRLLKEDELIPLYGVPSAPFEP